jgi:hypothetical protein
LRRENRLVSQTDDAGRGVALRLVHHPRRVSLN